jgi:hypothetical protein
LANRLPNRASHHTFTLQPCRIDWRLASSTNYLWLRSFLPACPCRNAIAVSEHTCDYTLASLTNPFSSPLALRRGAVRSRCVWLEGHAPASWPEALIRQLHKWECLWRSNVGEVSLELFPAQLVLRIFRHVNVRDFSRCTLIRVSPRRFDKI